MVAVLSHVEWAIQGEPRETAEVAVPEATEELEEKAEMGGKAGTFPFALERMQKMTR